MSIRRIVSPVKQIFASSTEPDELAQYGVALQQQHIALLSIALQTCAKIASGTIHHLELGAGEAQRLKVPSARLASKEWRCPLHGNFR